MRGKAFRSLRHKGDWEFNLVGKLLNIRVGYSQVALWWRGKPLINWVREYAKK